MRYIVSSFLPPYQPLNDRSRRAGSGPRIEDAPQRVDVAKRENAAEPIPEAEVPRLAQFEIGEEIAERIPEAHMLAVAFDLGRRLAGQIAIGDKVEWGS